ncbi:MAG: primase [Chlamydiales bacterium]|jgi:hypothetical protein|nr:primase [Chlamydiales bacterium]
MRLKAKKVSIETFTSALVKVEKLPPIWPEDPFSERESHARESLFSEEQTLWHCLKTCQSEQQAIHWLLQKGFTSTQAIAFLNRILSSEEEQPAPSSEKVLASDIHFGLDDAHLLADVMDYYHATLKESPEALHFLEEKGLSDCDLLREFKIGYANRTLGYHIPDQSRLEKLSLRKQLQRIGILRKTGHEHFNGSLVIPVFDRKGFVSAVYGQRIQSHLPENAFSALHVPSLQRGVFNEHGLYAKEVILAETILEAMTFWVGGLRHVTSVDERQGLSEEHIQAFKERGVRRVYIAYQRFGDFAASQAGKRLLAAGIEPWRLSLPGGMTANQYWQSSLDRHQLWALFKSAYRL